MEVRIAEVVADIAQDIRERFLAVNLEEKATQKKITTVEELYSYEACFEVVSDVALKFVTGFATKNS